MDGDDKGSEGMGMTKDRKEWENIGMNGNGWEILQETGMNEKAGKPGGWEGKVEELRDGKEWKQWK